MVSREVRDSIRRLYLYRCGYCGVSEAAVGSELEIDHYCPQSAAGGDEVENLVYCCTSCNRRKGSFWPGEGSAPRRLLHPLRDNLELHLRQETSGKLMGLTETGKFHIKRLELNRSRLVALRASWQAEREKEVASSTKDAKQQLLRKEILETARQIQRLFDEISRILKG